MRYLQRRLSTNDGRIIITERSGGVDRGPGYVCTPAAKAGGLGYRVRIKQYAIAARVRLLTSAVRCQGRWREKPIAADFSLGNDHHRPQSRRLTDQ